MEPTEDDPVAPSSSHCSTSSEPLGIVVSGFPGVGKSHFAKTSSLRVSDSDSSEFDKDGFPVNYVEAIKQRQKEFDIVLVSSHENVREEMERQGVYYQIVFPDYGLRDEYLQRYRDRGSPESFVQLISDNWKNWTEKCAYDGSYEYNELRSLNGYKLGPGRFIADVADRIVEFEKNRPKR